MLNMESWVTPNHFKAAQFEAFAGLSPAEEFDLVAPVLVYYRADVRYKPKARGALKKLKKLAHPLTEDKSVAELLDTAPDGLVNRYNALMMKIVADEAGDAEPRIDIYGAFGFRYGGDDNVLMGDVDGLFAFYGGADAVKKRLS
jgi:hypothetical protein